MNDFIQAYGRELEAAAERLARREGRRPRALRHALALRRVLPATALAAVLLLVAFQAVRLTDPAPDRPADADAIDAQVAGTYAPFRRDPALIDLLPRRTNHLLRAATRGGSPLVSRRVLRTGPYELFGAASGSRMCLVVTGRARGDLTRCGPPAGPILAADDRLVFGLVPDGFERARFLPGPDRAAPAAAAGLAGNGLMLERPPGGRLLELSGRGRRVVSDVPDP